MVKVLVCVDKSDIAEKTLKWYLTHFYKEGTEVIICNVPEYWGDLQRHMSPAKIDECVEKTNKETKDLEDKCGRICQEYNVPLCFEALKGKEAWHAIVEYAEKSNASAIVIGTRGMGTVKRTLFGSVSDGVLHHCHIPVLIYKQ